MNNNILNKINNNISGAIKNIDLTNFSKGFLRLGSHIAEKISKTNWNVTGKKAVKLITAAGTIYALGALSRQPEINKYRGEKQIETKMLIEENVRLRYAVKRLNNAVEILHNKINGINAYRFTEKAKLSEGLKGCIFYQYATKEYLEISIRKSLDETINPTEVKFVNAFNNILNNKYSQNDGKYIEQFIKPKYIEEITNNVEYDCLPLIIKMQNNTLR